MGSFLTMFFCFLPGSLLILYANVCWYKIKSILSKNGVKTHLLYTPLDELSKFKELIASTEDEQLAKKHKKLLRNLYLSGALGFFLFIVAVILTQVYGLDETVAPPL